MSKSSDSLTVVLLGAAALLSTQQAQARLYDRGNGMIYDNVLNITWLRDATYAKTSGQDSDGLFNWNAAQAWVSQLTYKGISGWRLPTLTPVGGGPSFNSNLSSNGSTDYGYNIAYPGRTSPFDAASTSVGFRGNELAYMFFVNLGNLAWVKTDGSGRSGVLGVNFGLANASFVDGATGATVSFQHLLGSEGFWTNFQSISTYTFSFKNTGMNDSDNKLQLLAAWAVHNGDVAAAAVPEPAAWRSMLVGLLLMTSLWAQRIRRASPVLRG